MGTDFFKNLRNLKTKGGSFTLNRDKASFNYKKTLLDYSEKHSRESNAAVQNYDNRQNYGFVLMTVLINTYQSTVSFIEAIPFRDL